MTRMRRVRRNEHVFSPFSFLDLISHFGLIDCIAFHFALHLRYVTVGLRIHEQDDGWMDDTTGHKCSRKELTIIYHTVYFHDFMISRAFCGESNGTGWRSIFH